MDSPNTGFQRITAMVSAQQQISRALRINFKSSYTYRKLNNTPALGYNSNSISYFLIFQNPNVNLDWLRPMWRTGQENVKQLQPYSSFIGNPYVILYDLKILRRNTVMYHPFLPICASTVNSIS